VEVPSCTHGIGSLVSKYEEKKPLQRPRRRWKDNNKSDWRNNICQCALDSSNGRLVNTDWCRTDWHFL